MKNTVYQKKSHKVLWSILIVLLIILAVFAAVFFAYFVQLDTNGTTPLNDSPAVIPMEFELDPGISYKHAVTDSYLFFYSAENIKIVNSSGKVEQDFNLPLSSPYLTSRGNYVLIADKGGRKAYLFHGAEQEMLFELPESIISASVNSKGCCVFVTKGESHKCSVSVLDQKGEEKFRWNSGGLYVLDADISDNSRDIAVSALNTSSGVLSSNIILFSIDKETPFTNDSFEDELFAAVRYSGTTLYCIGENKAYIYNGYGKQTGVVDYADRELLSYNTGGDALALVFAGSGLSIGASDVETYNVKGEMLGQFHSVQEAAFLDCRGGRIAVGSGRMVSILNTKCKEEFQISLDMDLLDFMFFRGEARAVGISASGAQFVAVSKN